MNLAATTDTATTCPYCGVGCGVRVRRLADGDFDPHGDPDHPANFGRLCSKGSALADTLGFEGRLLYPEVDGGRVGWDTALDTVATKMSEVLDRHGPQAIAFYVSGQLLTEDYYVANKLMKGFLGSANIDTNSRLCMAAAVAGHQRAFGADAVPGCYEDLEQADLLMLVGSNTAWCHPIVFQRMQAAKEARPGVTVVTIDPRRTATTTLSDLHLALAPGTDALLFNGLLAYLSRTGRLDRAFLAAHVEHADAALARARCSAPSIAAVARGCGLKVRDVTRFYRLFADNERVVTLFSQGINQSSSGADRVNAIINCHLATGRIGRPGAGPFSITGQPNAMGGREVGGLATQLAAHLPFTPEAIDRVGRFWGSDRVAHAPGLRAVELFEAIERGAVKLAWIMATNPAVSLPDADRMRAALARCETVIVSDCVRHTDTTACARILLPAATWGEKDGTVTNSERRISRQRAFRDPPGEARPDWWIISSIARRLGFAAQFPYRSPADIFREHARLSGFEQDGTRAFDISALATLSDTEYDALSPMQWPITAHAPRGTMRLFEDQKYFHPSGKARLVPVTPRAPAHATNHDYPLALNTGRIRDQWHTMTRTALSPRLGAHLPEPFVEVHPEDAARHGIAAGALARVTSSYGEMLARVRMSADQRPGSVFVPIHWSDAQARLARAGALVNPITDPVSGQPEFKHTPVRLLPFATAWHGFLLTRVRIGGIGTHYQVAIRVTHGWRQELAGEYRPESWREQVRAWCGDGGEWIEFEDRAAGRYRAARIDGDRLSCCLFIAPDPRLPDSGWLQDLFARERLTDAERTALLSGRAPQGVTNEGPIVCVCYGIGRDRLLHAMRDPALRTTQALGAKLRAGTNCGSCLPELRALLATQSAN